MKHEIIALKFRKLILFMRFSLITFLVELSLFEFSN